MLTAEEELELLILLEEEAKYQAEQSLSAYIKQAWDVIEPGTEYLHNWHIDAISEHLEAVSAGQIKRLLINIPPRYMKSISVSVCWPTWEWIRKPETRWIFASYSSSLSTKHSVDRRTIIQSDWYQKNWGNRFFLVSDQNVKTEYLNDKRGVMVSTSVGGTATGKGGNRIVVDDPHNPQEAQSDTQRESGVTFFNQTLTTRLDNKKKDAIVVVMQRLHEKDLSGYLLAQGGWEHLCLPAEADKRTIISMPISGKEIIREPDDLLWPEREDVKEIEQVKKDLGSYGYAGQYQQRPSPAEGGIFKRHWWQYYRHMPERFDEIIQSWDCTFKDTKGSDYVVGQIWGRIGALFYLLDQVRAKLNFPATLQAVKNLTAKWPNAFLKLIEDKANGPAVISTLTTQIPGLVPVNPEGGKEVRAHAVSSAAEAGNVFLPDPSIAPWINDFVEECAAFPNGANDDQVDGMTQALNRFLKFPVPDIF